MPNTPHYLKARVVNACNKIELDTLTDFCNFAERHQVKEIFVIADEIAAAFEFALLHNQTLISKPTEGFATLEDFKAATHAAFPEATSFYDAKREGYSHYEDYKMVKEAGITERSVFEEIKKRGFMHAFHEYKNLLDTNEALQPLAAAENPAQLYEYAKQYGFETGAEFITAFREGFPDASTYKIAVEKGFPDYAEYKDAMDRGFTSYKDLLLAREKKVRNYEDFFRYLDLDCLKDTGLKHDERVLTVTLSKLEQGKKISINKLLELLRKTTEEYRYTDTQQMPEWFTTGFDNDKAVIEFLTTNEAAKKYGHYDTDGEYFEINLMRDRTIIIDGSNVAHNSNGNGASKPCVTNIIFLVDHLKNKGFENIIVISDASLKHKLGDNGKMKTLKEKAKYIEAPKEQPADIFIIYYVKRTHCLLVSNDTFREWKVQDPWVAENIDYYRLSFIIDEKEVILPDLK